MGFWSITMDILKLHDPGYLDKYFSFPTGISLLKVQEKHATAPMVLDIDSITIYILKLHDSGYLDKYV